MTSKTINTKATVFLDSWAGRTSHAVEILKETPKRILVIWQAEPCFRFIKGEQYYIPKHAIVKDIQKEEKSS